MKPILVAHAQYQHSVLQRLEDSRVSLIPKGWPLAATFWMTDLSPVTSFLLDVYSTRDPSLAIPPSCSVRTCFSS
ncbi:hypothetical protein D3C87_2113190 [compost metagenome]